MSQHSMSFNHFLASLLLCSGVFIDTQHSLIAEDGEKGKALASTDPFPLRVDYVHYRPATYETRMVQENEDVHPNQGGLVYLYYTNMTDEVVDLAYWRLNHHDESVWRLDNLICWDRRYDSRILPGQTSVLEINGVSEDFQEGKPYHLEWIDKRTWQTSLECEGSFVQDPMSIPLIRLHKGLKTVDVHLRNQGKAAADIGDIAIAGKKIISSTLVGKRLEPQGHAICRLELDDGFSHSELLIAKVNYHQRGETHQVMAHRRAFADNFPIGTWGAEPEQYLSQRKHHIDTCVKGGDPTSAFYRKEALRFGYRSLSSVHLNNMALWKEEAPNPIIACLQLSDEPDWVTHPQQVLLQDNLVRRSYSHAPTMTTLCRNVTFFEYAPIVDLPCMDHYCVTAPSTSQWPNVFGTRLEETGIYTRDLKMASEPKPIWVWSQGLFDWDERPEQSVPTPEELGVQLVQNIGNGTKGILWFTFREGPGQQFPATKKAIQEWGRVLRLLRADLLESEPILPSGISAPPTVDCFALVTMSKLIVCLTNKEYLMASSGYQFKPIKDLEVQINLPSWIQPSGMVQLKPKGIQSVSHRYKDGKLVVSLDLLNDAAIVVASNAPNAEDVYQARLGSILSDENRDFSKGMCALVECRMQRHAQPEIQSTEEVMPLAIGADVDEVLHIDVAEPSLASTRTEGHELAWNLKVSSIKGDQGLSQEGYLLPNGNIVCRVTNSKRQSLSVAIHQGNLCFMKTVPSESTAMFTWPAR
jgi:hypothetical protein